jgi:hypothetical protein
MQVDYGSQTLPAIETIQLFGFTENMAEYHITNIKHSHPDIAMALGEPNQVNGVGKAKLVASLFN